ncbi:hypothetical protein P3445_22505 [Vibrio parahaemolyticus]|nr:hypothetical protein [Vibrio parahaemolyticus]
MLEKKEQIKVEIKRIAKLLGKDSLKQDDFKKHSKVTVGTVHNTFGSWNDAVIEAGLKPTDRVTASEARKADDNELLKDLLRLEAEHGKVTAALVNSKGKFSAKPYTNRWKNVKNALEVAKSKNYSSDAITSMAPVLKCEQVEEARRIRLSDFSGLYSPKEKPKKRPTVGYPIDFRGMRFAPINEQGVVYLFGVVSQELGFLVETVRVGFPDCEAKRYVGKNEQIMEHVNIEFEYKSSNFVEHGHDPEQCDLIVCWEHDWDSCPLEVLELKTAINFLPEKVG